jgi:hypothetical protein
MEPTMPFPDLKTLTADLEDFDRGPLAYSPEQCKELRCRIYHAFYYHQKGWLFMTFMTEVRLARMLARVKSVEAYYAPSYEGVDDLCNSQEYV